MRTNKLGSGGPEISVIGYGAWEAGGDAWGPNESDVAVIAAMREALDAGITWIDTAEVYGKGISETLVGRAVVGRRDEVLIASKVAPADAGSGFRPAEIRTACAASLDRLGIETLDLYQLHWPDPFDTPVEDSWGAMCDLQDAGSVRFIGVSNFDRGLVERCEAIRHVDSLQQEFSMLQLEDRELIRWCGEHGTGVVSYSPLAAGLLTGGVRAATFGEDDWRGGTEGTNLFGPGNLEQNLSVVDGMIPVAERLGITLAQLALAWNIAQPGVTSAIAGSRNPAHVRANAAAGDVELDLATLAELEGLLGQTGR
jgi:aryl-alcohol dehydrogenase-like predicted oxidoreductase